MEKKKLLKKAKYLLRFLPDKTYIQLYYFLHFHKPCNFKKPVTFNEKLNWLKIHDRNPVYRDMVDKYEVKKYVANVIGEEYVVPTIGVWDKFNDIDFSKLPNSFVLKCTHDSEGIFICTDKSRLDINAVRKKINSAMQCKFFYIGREWPYKRIKPRIIAEPYLVDHARQELWDYKFFCFHGEPKYMYIATDRVKGETKFDYYDMEFNHLNIIQHYPNNMHQLPKPETWDKMVELARMLAKGILHVRVDFYEVNGKTYFGELTFYHLSGFIPFQPEEWDKKFGELLKLPI